MMELFEIAQFVPNAACVEQSEMCLGWRRLVTCFLHQGCIFGDQELQS